MRHNLLLLADTLRSAFALKGVRMRTHRLDAGPDTVHWGFFDAALKPLVTVEPGDEVIMSTVSGAPQQMPHPSSGLTVPAALPAIYASVPQKLNGPHIMTGPVAVRGAKAGQVLEVRIKAIDLNYGVLGLQLGISKQF